MSHQTINAVPNLTIFREYIGVKDGPKVLDDFPVEIINPKIDEFHFILGFCTEVYDENKYGTGNFSRDWNFENFSPKKVVDHKEKHDNMKVMISIGGHGIEYPFNPNPNETEIWISNATTSIKNIILGYENYLKKDGSSETQSKNKNVIDGIDINYEYINSSVADFSKCIGEVIERLKADDDISQSMGYVSVAPTELLQEHYRILCLDHKKNITYVDYKFYNQKLSVQQFIDLFNTRIVNYAELRVLVGVSTDPSDTLTERGIFIDGIKKLITNVSLPGISVWNANDSATPPNDDVEPYYLEKILQNLLTKN